MQTYGGSKHCNSSIDNTLENKDFQKLLTAKLKAWESELLESQSFTIDVDKNIANIFASSCLVSSTIAVCPYLFSAEREVSSLALESTVKEKENEKKDIDEETKQLLDLISNLQHDIAYLKKELDLKEHELPRRTEDSEILMSLHNQGIINKDGNPILEE